jgi:hypothetical protein
LDDESERRRFDMYQSISLILETYLRNFKTITSRRCPRAHGFILSSDSIEDGILLLEQFIKYMNPKFGAVIASHDLEKDLFLITIRQGSTLNDITTRYAKILRRFQLTRVHPPIPQITLKFLQQLARAPKLACYIGSMINYTNMHINAQAPNAKFEISIHSIKAYLENVGIIPHEPLDFPHADSRPYHQNTIAGLHHDHPDDSSQLSASSFESDRSHSPTPSVSSSNHQIAALRHDSNTRNYPPRQPRQYSNPYDQPQYTRQPTVKTSNRQRQSPPQSSNNQRYPSNDRSLHHPDTYNNRPRPHDEKYINQYRLIHGTTPPPQQPPRTINALESNMLPPPSHDSSQHPPPTYDDTTSLQHPPQINSLDLDYNSLDQPSTESDDSFTPVCASLAHNIDVSPSPNDYFSPHLPSPTEIYSPSPDTHLSPHDQSSREELSSIATSQDLDTSFFTIASQSIHPPNISPDPTNITSHLLNQSSIPSSLTIPPSTKQPKPWRQLSE